VCSREDDRAEIRKREVAKCEESWRGEGDMMVVVVVEEDEEENTEDAYDDAGSDNE
jgi:hypothetical protein